MRIFYKSVYYSEKSSIDRFNSLNCIILFFMVIALYYIIFYGNSMEVCLIVVSEYEGSLKIKIDGNIVIKIIFDVKLIFPLLITLPPNRFICASGCHHFSSAAVVARAGTGSRRCGSVGSGLGGSLRHARGSSVGRARGSPTTGSVREMRAAGGLVPCFNEAPGANGGGRSRRHRSSGSGERVSRPITMLSVIRMNQSILCFLHG
jgi:hypothetical protein